MRSAPSLEARNIEFVNSESSGGLTDCLPELRGLFQCITAARELRYATFASSKRVPVGQTPAGPDPEREWRKEMKNDALELTVVARDKQRSNDTEDKWIAKLEPIVFYRLLREEEENYNRNRHHHCFICHKHFPMYSRPRISKGSKRAIDKRTKAWSEMDRGVESSLRYCREHLNLPNFDFERLPHKASENDTNRIPDRTIGLLSSNEKDWFGVEGPSVLLDDRVRWFNPRIIRELEDRKIIAPALTSMAPRRDAKRNTRPTAAKRGGLSITFPFGIWEAKKPSGGCDLEAAQVQNSVPVNEILQWQDDTRKRAHVSWNPLVWHFVNVGADWVIHACHFQRNPTGTGMKQLQRRLWSGNIQNEDSALQLLYIIDIISMWGQHEYKPFAGACIQRMHAMYQGVEVPLRKKTLLRHQMKVNDETFPWLSHSCGWEGLSRQSTLDDSTSWDPYARLARGIESMAITSTIRQSLVPELDCFVWLLDRYDRSLKVDHLVVRVNRSGQIQPPMIVYHDPDWSNPDFGRVIENEFARLSRGATAVFRRDRKNQSFMKSCACRSGFLRELGLQFCAIVPLRLELYEKKVKERRLPFRQLEKKLKINELIMSFESANDKWCSCEAPYNEHSPSMILCDNRQCKIGWYHKKCVRLSEDYEAKYWFCDPCAEHWNTIDHKKFDISNLDQEIIDASDTRVQTMRAISRVWDKHPWPKKQDQVLQWFDRISSEIQIADTELGDTDENPRSKSRCCALKREDPSKMAAVYNFMRAESSG